MSTEIRENKKTLTHTLCFLFSGKAGVGKTYCSGIALKAMAQAGYAVANFPFAKGVKDTALLMGWDGKKDQRGRQLLQSIGQIGRRYDELTWAKRTFNEVESSAGYPFDAIFIDDWRFKNEIKYITDYERLYKVVPIRIDAPNREILKGTREYEDISETELDDFEFKYVFDNSFDGIEYIKSNLLDMLIKEISETSLY